MNSSTRGLVTFLLGAAAGTGSAQADVLTVSAGESIQAAIDAAFPGDEIVVGPGVYNETISYKNQNLVVRSLGGPAVTTIDGTGISAATVEIEAAVTGLALLEGFTITGGQFGGLRCLGSPKVAACWFLDNDGNTSGSSAVRLIGSQAVFERCLIAFNESPKGAVLVENGTNGALATFRRCTITRNEATDISNPGALNILGALDVALEECIVWANSPFNLAGSTASSVFASYSDIQFGWPGTGNIDEDPMFVDAPGGDFTLQSGSPCIDAGNPASPLDPDGSIADIGAFAFASGPLPSLIAESAVISLAAGGEQRLVLDAGAGNGGSFYWMFGSISGTSPGFDFGGGVVLPLNFDGYFGLTLKNPTAIIFKNFIGFLNNQGRALASVELPAGLDPSLVGLTLHHAFTAAATPGVVDFASNAVALELVP